MMKTMLLDLKVPVLEACDGTEAVKQVTQSLQNPSRPQIKLILMDLCMPRMDGIEAAREIRALERRFGRHTKIPIVAVTGTVTTEDEVSCREVGMQDFEAKPVTKQTLQRILSTKYASGLI